MRLDTGSGRGRRRWSGTRNQAESIRVNGELGQAEKGVQVFKVFFLGDGGRRRGEEGVFEGLGVFLGGRAVGGVSGLFLGLLFVFGKVFWIVFMVYYWERGGGREGVVCFWGFFFVIFGRRVFQGSSFGGSGVPGEVLLQKWCVLCFLLEMCDSVLLQGRGCFCFNYWREVGVSFSSEGDLLGCWCFFRELYKFFWGVVWVFLKCLEVFRCDFDELFSRCFFNVFAIFFEVFFVFEVCWIFWWFSDVCQVLLRKKFLTCL